MNKKYQDWIVKKNYNSMQNVIGKCDMATKQMIKEFPELQRVAGVVYSRDNPDNFNRKQPKEYTHWWCVDPDRNIVDPTKEQFQLIGKLEYREMNTDEPISKCIGCGKYIQSNSRRCGECEWTKE